MGVIPLLSSWGFCEQEGWSGNSPPILLRPRVARAQKIISLHPPSVPRAGGRPGTLPSLFIVLPLYPNSSDFHERDRSISPALLSISTGYFHKALIMLKY
jgi:hypothetical protein